MKKILFTLSLSIPVILPTILVSCSQNSDQNRINEAREKVQKVITEKPQPTLATQPNASIDLANYLQLNSFIAPKSDLTGIKIELDSIELPTPNSTNLIIWLKVTSTDTLDIIADISDFYSINFNEIAGIDSTNIQPITIDQLSTPFTNLLNAKRSLLNKFINEAISGTGFFEGQTKIDPTTLINDPKELNDRLTTNNLNENIFENHQKNVYVEFLIYDANAKTISLTFELRELDNSDKVTFDMQFELIELGRSL